MQFQKKESKKHRDLKLELAKVLRSSWRIDAVDGEGESTGEVENSENIGDGQNKKPDIDAFDEEVKRKIRGEAKTGDDDLDTEHSITQYRLFTNLNLKGIPSWLFITVPEEDVAEMKRILEENLSASQRQKVGVIASKNY